MTIQFICEICKRNFNKKYNYIKHTKRKTPCIDYTKIIKLKEDEVLEDKFLLHKKTPNSTIVPQFSTKEIYDINLKSEDKKPFCKYCKKYFSRSDSLARHHYICKTKLEQDDAKRKENKLINIIIKKEAENKKLKLLLKKSSKNIQTNNIKNNNK